MLSYSLKRRDIIKETGDILHVSKRAIFALHRDNLTEAKEKIDTATQALAAIQKRYKKEPLLLQEGAYKAAAEEYVEAVLFYQFVTEGRISKIRTVVVDSDTYIAGLSDVPGELYRYAINAATARNEKKVTQCALLANDIVAELIECNLTSYLRTKFDQATQAAQKIERVVYELSLAR